MQLFFLYFYIMIEQLFKLIQNESQQDIIDNPNIPNEMNNQAVGLATESIFGGLQSALANGGLQQVMGLFTGGGSGINASNPLVSGIANNFIQSLMKKFGLDGGIASSIAGSLIPMILGKLVTKTNSPENNGFDINGLLGSLMGVGGSQNQPVQVPGKTGGIDFGNILGSMMKGGGLDSNRDGNVDLQDIVGLVTGAASNSQQQQQQGGGFMDLLGGLMGGK